MTTQLWTPFATGCTSMTKLLVDIIMKLLHTSNYKGNGSFSPSYLYSPSRQGHEHWVTKC